jgi:hypothetical protein
LKETIEAQDMMGHEQDSTNPGYNEELRAEKLVGTKEISRKTLGDDVASILEAYINDEESTTPEANNPIATPVTYPTLN